MMAFGKDLFEHLQYRPPNGERYPLVGGMRQRHFAGTNFKLQNGLKTRRIPPIHCTLCWAAFYSGRTQVSTQTVNKNP